MNVVTISLNLVTSTDIDEKNKHKIKTAFLKVPIEISIRNYLEKQHSRTFISF